MYPLYDDGLLYFLQNMFGDSATADEWFASKVREVLDLRWGKEHDPVRGLESR